MKHKTDVKESVAELRARELQRQYKTWSCECLTHNTQYIVSSDTSSEIRVEFHHDAVYISAIDFVRYNRMAEVMDTVFRVVEKYPA